MRRLSELTARFRMAYLPRCVFIHINKTAGSSIERALGLRFEHKTALEKRAELGSLRWRRAFKFGFVRNPWDKVFSHYQYRVKSNQTGMADGHISFRDWVLRAYGDHDLRYYDQPRMFMPQVNWLSDESGHLLVDFVGRFETLSKDFNHVCERLGMRRELPHLKRSTSSDYKAAYDAETRECIAQQFAAEPGRFQVLILNLQDDMNLDDNSANALRISQRNRNTTPIVSD